jgi:uncharacterized protein YdaU (DUF1376 family)
MPLFCGDYLADTKHLNLEQHGAYLVLLMVTWRNNGKAIQDDPNLISKYLGCTRDRWLKKIKPVLEPMFDTKGGFWRSNMLEKQWAYVQENSSRKSANGKLGGRPPAAKVTETSSNFSAETFNKNTETETSNVLINNESDEAIGSVSVPSSLSNQPLNQLEEESKKESPLSPPMGGMVEGVLFPVQEVQHAPDRGTSAPRRKRNDSQPVVASSEIEAAFVEFKAIFPKRNNPHTWTKAKDHFVSAMKSGVPGELLIQTAGMYAQSMKFDGKIGSSVVVDARRWLNERRWENYADFQPILNPKPRGNVTPMRAFNNGQVPNEYIRRGGRQG